MKTTRTIITIAILILVAGVFLWQRRATAPTPPIITQLPVPQTPSPQATVVPTPLAQKISGDVREFTITARQYTFDPGEIRVKNGDRVRITLTSIDVTHGIAIPEFGFNLTAQVGETQSAEFVADKTGTFDLFCSLFCGSGHRDMKGKLIVEPR